MDSAGIPHRKAVWVCSRRPWASSHAGLLRGTRAACLSMAYRPCGQIIDATLVLTPKQHFTTEEKDIVEQGATPSDRSPTKRRQRGPGRLLVDKRYNLIRRLETVMPPPHDRPALRRRTGPDEHERGGLCWYGLCPPRTRESVERGGVPGSPAAQSHARATAQLKWFCTHRNPLSPGVMNTGVFRGCPLQNNRTVVINRAQ
jgi:hypothetical protein